MMTAIPEIREFKGHYGFLSNFWPSRVELGGQEYDTVEHAYQAAKTLDKRERAQIKRASAPMLAKRLGRMVTLRPDWEEVKDEVMLDLLRKKFSGNSFCGMWLIQTGDAKLVEGNGWHDNYWGACQCFRCVDKPKLNKLGKLLMQVRGEINDVG